MRHYGKNYKWYHKTKHFADKIHLSNYHWKYCILITCIKLNHDAFMPLYNIVQKRITFLLFWNKLLEPIDNCRMLPFLVNFILVICSTKFLILGKMVCISTKPHEKRCKKFIFATSLILEKEYKSISELCATINNKNSTSKPLLDVVSLPF